MTSFNASTAQMVFLDGDTNGDGVVNAKDLRMCPATDIAAELKSLIDTDTTVTYSFGSLVDVNPNDGQKKLVLNGSDGSTTCVLIPDSTELPDINTTYTLQVIGSTLTIVGSDGSTSGGSVTIQTYDEDLTANGDGSFTFVDDDGGTITIPRPRTAEEICQAVVAALSVNASKLNTFQLLINQPLIDRINELESCVDDLKSIN